MSTDSSLLNSELELHQQEELYQQLLFLYLLTSLSFFLFANLCIFFLLLFLSLSLALPTPGMCVKTLSEPGKDKVFVNICQSNSVPPPPDLSREELVELLKILTTVCSQSCTAFDVVINQEFFQRCQKDPLFQQFVILVSLEGLEHKYALELSRDWKVLKNRKFLGSLGEHNIRTKNRPMIQELQPQYVLLPEFTLLVEPSTGDPEYLIGEIKLPGVPSSRSLVLDVGEDRLVLTARPSLFHLDIFHPFLIDQQNSVAQYNKSTQVLTVTMPVVSS
uniref:PIH1 domain-containing protein 1 n=1 Tax=Monopterus albus TaxID=43700 RepID=A0A3Q3JJA7_MONAL